MNSEITGATGELREFLFKRVYNLNSAQGEVAMARDVVRKLYHYYNENEDRLPPEYRLGHDETARRVVDYIAGMTDQYALKLAGGISA